MRTAKKTVPTLDLFCLAAVLLVVMNHTSPLADVSARVCCFSTLSSIMADALPASRNTLMT